TRLALSVTDAPQAASWIEGVLQGSALLILHQDNLWRALDRWLSELSGETFEALLPVLRRAFANFQPPERRAMGEKVRALGSTAHGSDRQTAGTMLENLDQQRAALVLPLLSHIVGV
ncbi:MAG TPA: DUF5682 family protein, partial [Ktedonobacteraceae bacterium]